jgi:hypothetical protein
MKLSMTVKPIEGEPYDVTARFGDFVAFERTWNRSVAKLESEMRLTDIAWLAWQVSKRIGKTTEPFDPTWIQSIDEVAVKDDSADSPLDKTAPTG